MNIFTIYDNKAKAYLTPFFTRNIDTAIRDCKQIVNTTDHNFSIHAEDYSLFHIGEYDETSGKIIAQPPTHVINLLELKKVSVNYPHRDADLVEALDIQPMEEN